MKYHEVKFPNNTLLSFKDLDITGVKAQVWFKSGLPFMSLPCHVHRSIELWPDKQAVFKQPLV